MIHYLFFKRAFDVLTCGISFIFLMPLFIIIAGAIKFSSKGSVFFFQKRVGKDKKIFMIAKFRTMFCDTPRDIPTHMLCDPALRITPIGRFLRRTSLDELPQLLNILAGDMSIVGPRPALYNQYDLIAERDRYGVNTLVPGLTGWAQINGRDELPIPEKAKLDGYYTTYASFFLDTKIIFLTIMNVFTGKGVFEGRKE